MEPTRLFPIIVLLSLGRAGYSAGVQWLAGALLRVGVLAQSGGFFVHLALGQQGRRSPGTVLTRPRGTAASRCPDHLGHRPDHARITERTACGLPTCAGGRSWVQ